MDPLEARLHGSVIGILRATSDGVLAFRYHPDAAQPISVSLPLSREEYHGGAAEAFFANLLPDGAIREAVARRFGVSPGNDLELLRAIGGECAGALSLVPLGAPNEHDDGYERLGRSRIDKLLRSDGALSLLIGGRRSRLSLAGAQYKLPVRVEGGELYLPVSSAPTSHILKLPNATFKHLPANERLVSLFAQELGLPVVEQELWTNAAEPLLLVRRYDRQADGTSLRRLHQEDFCQATGTPPARKYELEGGPSFAACIDVVRAHAALPLGAVRALLRWQLFNLIAGNADGHGKNLALVYRGGAPELAPFYDLVCTRAYRSLEPRLAMTIGGEGDPARIGPKELDALSRSLAIGPRVAATLAAEMLEQAPDALQRARRSFRELHGSPPVLELVPARIRKSLRHTRELFRLRARA